MSSIVPHVFPETGQPVRTVIVDSEPWWVAADVCAVLEIGNPSQAVVYLDDDEKRKASSTLISNEGGGDPWIISEPGLYSLILRSRKPQAKPFRRWITHEVIPSIRRTGSYEASPAPQLAMPSHAIALRGWAAELEAREVAEARVAELEPIAQAYDVIASAKGDFSLRDAAFVLNRDPGIKTGQNRLLKTLRELGMVDRSGVPYAKHSTHLTERIHTYPHPATGEPTLAKRPQIRVTVAGMRYLHHRIGGVAPLRFDQLPLDPAA